MEVLSGENLLPLGDQLTQAGINDADNTMETKDSNEEEVTDVVKTDVTEKETEKVGQEIEKKVEALKSSVSSNPILKRKKKVVKKKKVVEKKKYPKLEISHEGDNWGGDEEEEHTEIENLCDIAEEIGRSELGIENFL